MEEIRKPVVGYEWLYEISDQWKIKRLERMLYYVDWRSCVLKEYISKWTLWTDWYISLYLTQNWCWKNIRAHVLIAQAFIPNPENKLEVNHKDLNRSNNAIDNLEWTTHKENMQDAWNKRKRKTPNNIWKIWKLCKVSKKLYQLSLAWDFIKEWDSTMDIQRELWFKNPNISACCLWRKKQAYGFIRKYTI